jgi:hypothetical protein
VVRGAVDLAAGLVPGRADDLIATVILVVIPAEACATGRTGSRSGVA